MEEEVLPIWNSWVRAVANLSHIDDAFNGTCWKEMSHGFSKLWMSHWSIVPIQDLPDNFEVICEVFRMYGVAAFKNKRRRNLREYSFTQRWTQFKRRQKNLHRNFVLISVDALRIGTSGRIYRCFNSRFDEKLELIKLVMAVFLGVDSSVAAPWFHRAIGRPIWSAYLWLMVCFVKNEFGEVRFHKHYGLNLWLVWMPKQKNFWWCTCRRDRFPEAKRKAIGKCILRGFDEESNKLEG